MGEILRTIVSSASNAFRSDGYARSVGSYRSLGESSRIIQSKRSTAIAKNIKTTNARTEKIGK